MKLIRNVRGEGKLVDIAVENGKIKVGCDADFNTADESFNLIRSIVRGEV